MSETKHERGLAVVGNSESSNIVAIGVVSETGSVIEIPQTADKVWSQIRSLRGCVMNAGIKGLAAYSAFKFAVASALGWKVFKVVTEFGMDGVTDGLRNLGVLNGEERIPADDIMREFLTTMVALENGNPLLYRSLVGLATVGTSPAFWALITALWVRVNYRRMFEEGGEAAGESGAE